MSSIPFPQHRNSVSKRNLELNCQVRKRGLGQFYERAKVAGDAQKKAEAVFRKHLEGVCGILDGEKKPNLQLPSVRAKVKSLTRGICGVK
jgi:hypothetical protein